MAGFGTFVSKAMKSSFTPPGIGYGVSGAVFAGSLLQPLVKAAIEPGGEGHLIEQENANQRRLLLQRLKADRVKRQVNQAAAMLAARDPHLYSEIMAGERLVSGEMVIGGGQRTDLMGMLAGRMAMGQYNQPKQNVEEQVMAFLQQR